jgi:hypothetical protein
LHAALGQGSRDAAGRWTIPIQVKVVEPVPEGKTAAQLDICTDDPDYEQLPVLITVTRPAAQRCSALPAEVKVTGLKGQPLPARLVLIRDTREEAVVIDRIKADHVALHCTWAPGPGALATVKIQIDAAQLPENRLETFVHVELAAPQKETITIPVLCETE